MTDNPLVFADDAEILSGGNFHGQPLSLPLDHVALAMCELASFAERRVYALLTPSYAELPAFLTPRPGLSSGLMIAQYAAAALVSECQVLVASGRAPARSRPRRGWRTSTRWARSRR